MRKVSKHLYQGISAISIVLFIIIYIRGVFLQENYEFTTVKADQVTDLGDGRIRYGFDLANYDSQKKDIAFFATHQYVSVTEDGKLLTSTSEKKDFLGKTPGSFWTFASISENTKRVEITISKVYENTTAAETTFYMGSSVEIYKSLMRKSIPLWIVGGIIIILGITLILYWLLMNKRADLEDRSMLYLGIFSFTLGMWSANESDAMNLIYRDYRVSYILTYFLLMLLSIPFLMFLREFLRDKAKGYYVIVIICCVNFIVLTGLQFFQVADFKETITSTHVTMAITLIYSLYRIISNIMHGKMHQKLRPIIFGAGCLLAATVFDIILYYMHVRESDIVGKVAFLAFIVMFGLETAKNIEQTIAVGRNASKYLEMATLDILTGLFNRTAYEKDIESIRNKNRIVIYTFDLNNLKKCNDEHGHKIGDEFIVKSAQMIEKTFGRYGKCYRIGGDEFCCIITDEMKKALSYPIEQIRKEEHNFNRTKLLPVQIKIAIGYAIYDGTSGEDFEAARDRADAMMYENKEELKR